MVQIHSDHFDRNHRLPEEPTLQVLDPELWWIQVRSYALPSLLADTREKVRAAADRTLRGFIRRRLA